LGDDLCSETLATISAYRIAEYLRTTHETETDIFKHGAASRKDDSMIAIVNIILIGVVLSVTYIAFKTVEGGRNKFLSTLGGASAFVLLAAVLPSANEEAKPIPSADVSAKYTTGALPKEKPTVGVTLRNYKNKGDSVNLECSGTTGNITCKPKR
jgi:hypothetical protein